MGINTQNDLADKLREARLEAGLSQLDAAKGLSKTQSYISRCETGKRRLSVEELIEFARFYKKSISFFVTLL